MNEELKGVEKKAIEVYFEAFSRFLPKVTKKTHDKRQS
jgi:hypothetical protein